MTHPDQSGRKVAARTSLADAVDPVFRNGRVLGAAAAAVTAGAVLLLFALPRQYRAEALLLMKNERATAVITPTESGRTAAAPVSETDLRTETELLQSREMLEKAAVAANLVPANSYDSETLAKVTARVRKALRVTPVLKADMIRLEYRSSSRWEGDRFLRELLRIYQDKHIALRSGAKIRLFEEEAARLAEELRSKERELAEFQQNSEVYLLREQKSLALRKLVDIEASMHDAELRQIDSEQRVRHIEALLTEMPHRITTQVRRLPNQYSVERLRTMLVELENRRVELQTKFVDGDPLLTQNAAQIATTQKALAEATGTNAVEEATDLNPSRQQLENDLLRMRVEASAAEARHTQLATQRAKVRQELARLESKTAEYDGLERQVRELTERYQLHARKSEEARIDSALDERRVMNVAVAQAPAIPGQPEPRPYGLAVGLWTLGMAVVALAGWVMSRSQNVFYTPARLEQFTGIPVLGTVPMGGIRHERAA